MNRSGASTCQREAKGSNVSLRVFYGVFEWQIKLLTLIYKEIKLYGVSEEINAS